MEAPAPMDAANNAAAPAPAANSDSEFVYKVPVHDDIAAVQATFPPNCPVCISYQSSIISNNTLFMCGEVDKVYTDIGAPGHPFVYQVSVELPSFLVSGTKRHHKGLLLGDKLQYAPGCRVWLWNPLCKQEEEEEEEEASASDKFFPSKEQRTTEWQPAIVTEFHLATTTECGTAFNGHYYSLQLVKGHPTIIHGVAEAFLAFRDRDQTAVPNECVQRLASALQQSYPSHCFWAMAAAVQASKQVIDTKSQTKEDLPIIGTNKEEHRPTVRARPDPEGVAAAAGQEKSIDSEEDTEDADEEDERAATDESQGHNKEQLEGQDVEKDGTGLVAFIDVNQRTVTMTDQVQCKRRNKDQGDSPGAVSMMGKEQDQESDLKGDEDQDDEQSEIGLAPVAHFGKSVTQQDHVDYDKGYHATQMDKGEEEEMEKDDTARPQYAEDSGAGKDTKAHKETKSRQNQEESIIDRKRAGVRNNDSTIVAQRPAKVPRRASQREYKTTSSKHPTNFSEKEPNAATNNVRIITPNRLKSKSLIRKFLPSSVEAVTVTRVLQNRTPKRSPLPKEQDQSRLPLPMTSPIMERSPKKASKAQAKEQDLILSPLPLNAKVLTTERIPKKASKVQQAKEQDPSQLPMRKHTRVSPIMERIPKKAPKVQAPSRNEEVLPLATALPCSAAQKCFPPVTASPQACPSPGKTVELHIPMQLGFEFVSRALIGYEGKIIRAFKEKHGCKVHIDGELVTSSFPVSKYRQGQAMCAFLEGSDLSSLFRARLGLEALLLRQAPRQLRPYLLASLGRLNNHRELVEKEVVKTRDPFAERTSAEEPDCVTTHSVAILDLTGVDDGSSSHTILLRVQQNRPGCRIELVEFPPLYEDTCVIPPHVAIVGVGSNEVYGCLAELRALFSSPTLN